MKALNLLLHLLSFIHFGFFGSLLGLNKNGEIFIPGKGCGISTPITFLDIDKLDIMPENYKNLTCVVMKKPKILMSDLGTKI